MNRPRRPFFSGLFIGIFLVAGFCQAAWWNPRDWKLWHRGRVPERVDMLVVTGNYVHSRLLAELIQVETRQPVLLVPGDAKEPLYALGPEKDAIRVAPEHYEKFVEFVQPRRVLVIGGPDYVAPAYVERLEKRLPVWQVRSPDWERVAISCGEMLRLKHLAFDYLVLASQIEDASATGKREATPDFGNFMELKVWQPQGD